MRRRRPPVRRRSRSCTTSSTSGRSPASTCQPESRQLPRRTTSSTSRCATGTSRARPPTSASRSPTARATTGTSGSTPRSATSASTREWCDATRRGLRRLVARATETEIHHFIGKDITYFHTLFWPAMLKTAGLQPADEGPHPRLPHRRRREDVEAQGHLHPRRRPTSSTSTRPTCATTTPAEAVQQGRRPRPEPRGVRRQGEHRPGRQGRQPRQPHRASSSQRPGLSDDLSRRRRAVRSRPPPPATRSPRPTRPATTPAPCA